MTRKQIDTSREVRLWIGQILIPACTLVATAMTIPEVRYAVRSKVESAKRKFTKK